jgi:hypothetical protein
MISWLWSVEQLSGKRTSLVDNLPTRQVIKFGMDSSIRQQGKKKRHDERIVAILEEHGNLSTPDIFEAMLRQGNPIGTEQIFKICKRLQAAEIIGMTISKRPHTGQKLSIWYIKSGTR